MYNKITTIISYFLLIFYSTISTAGEVYLVLGSDTAIWEGMSVNRYNCYYKIDLYTNPSRNAYQVMDPAFRAQFIDSYGQPVKMTWWMMAGNIFRYAENTNIPIPNIMTMYLMKKYHHDNVIANEDELSLHYHTFYWSDYDNDGIFYWNQSLTFLESLDDFNFTLAQFLIDEHVFPVSFRSGWHYMDNDWQHYLDDRVLPYSMHNDWPAKRTDLIEPLDNTYDWSLSPAEFVPWHPSTSNYQLPGDGSGWNVRSDHFNGTRYLDLMDTIFAEAADGIDQVACFWGHLPETDFLTNIEILDSLAHRAAAQYPGVNFRYCTAIEAMQLWRKSNDSQAPTVLFTDIQNGDYVTFRIQSDEPIFQTQPFVVVKDVYERYVILECTSVAYNEWETSQLVLLSNLAKAAVAVCDTMGNQTLEFIDYLPDDEFIDNLDAGYVEVYGNWQTYPYASWGTDSRIVTLNQNDSAKVQWQYVVPQTLQYNIFVQIPDHVDAADFVTFTIFDNQQPIDTIEYNSGIPAEDWIFLSTNQLHANSDLVIEMKANDNNQVGKVLSADVVKITPLVRIRYLYLSNENIDFGQVSIEDTVSYDLQISNLGVQDLQLQNISSLFNSVSIQTSFPLNIPAMGKENITLNFSSTTIGTITDTLIIESDDSVNPIKKLPIYAEVLNYFEIIDNEDSLNYEEYGAWYTSVAQAYGPSSRYAWLNSSPRAYARFYIYLKKSGLYEIFEIVPTTINSSDDALYQFSIGGIIIDSIYINQNQGSGGWVSIGQHNFPSNTEIELKVVDTGNSTVGAVIRADAIKLNLIQEISRIQEDNLSKVPSHFHLDQNYPNPFNPETRIKFALPKPEKVKIEVYNIIGQKIETLLNKSLPAGYHEVEFNGQNLSSGIYLYRIDAGEFHDVKKMVLLK
jgi:hypothetical protein